MYCLGGEVMLQILQKTRRLEDKWYSYHFQGPLKMSLPQDSKKQSREHDAHIAKGWVGWFLVIRWGWLFFTI